MIEQTRFAYSPLGKAFEKQTETLEYRGRKQGNFAIFKYESAIMIIWRFVSEKPFKCRLKTK